MSASARRFSLWLPGHIGVNAVVRPAETRRTLKLCIGKPEISPSRRVRGGEGGRSGKLPGIAHLAASCETENQTRSRVATALL